MYPQVNSRQSFPELEAKILDFWKKNKTFQKSLDIRAGADEFVFYDGPPFATGLPHYGHLLGGTLKDIIPRYQTMKGKYVERRFGWDCHGLPIENIVEKKLKISGKRDIEDKIGVYEFNEQCRSNVMVYTTEWRRIVEKMGRWIDMDNDYKTMDQDFMESVWWVFKSLFDKGHIYESQRVVPYCTRCSTPLSNFEVNQGYEDRQDKSTTVKFKIKGNDNKYILAWTTTPWTLPANLGLAIGAEIEYSEVLDKKTGETYILATDRLANYYKDEADYKIVRNYQGCCLAGIEYEPLFNDFELLRDAGDLPKGMELGENVYRVVIGHHVTTESGTGVVHIAPAYGEDDSIIGKKENLGVVSHIDDTGKVENLFENSGDYVFDFNEKVIQMLKTRGDIINISTINHSYPHCYRCKTPLIYRGISAWYVKVEEVANKLVKNNAEVNWVPENIKDGRFGKWIAQARDWNISRNRYWGSAMPIWRSEDKEEIYCVGSIEELYELNKDFGQIEKRPHPTFLSQGEENMEYKYFYVEEGIEVDLHKHFVDKIKLKHPKTGTVLTRIPEVLDCWFESGSMPYASKHYPFKGKEDFKYPGDFIAEGIDQTRGWFYTLMILGTLLFDRTPYLNVIVNGIVLAEDGRKMSKSLNNYPDPEKLIDKHGADAIRFYMMNSGAVKAEDMKFSESGVEEIIKKVILPFWNTYSFFTTYANIDKFEGKEKEVYKYLGESSFNNLDKWILSQLQELIKSTNNGFETYDLNAVTRPIFDFMDNLTNWYIRRSRRRFWKSENDGDKIGAYHTLYEVLVELSKVIAPIMPFVSEEVFKNLTNKESVHLENYPECKSDLISESLNSQMEKTQKIINLGLALRANKKIRVRQPLTSLTIGEKLEPYYQEIIKEELNIKEIIILSDMTQIAKKICRPNAKLIGPRFGKDVQNIIIQAKNGNFQDLGEGRIKIPHPNPLPEGEGISGFILEEGEYEIAYEPLSGVEVDIEAGFGMVIAVDTKITEQLKLEGIARDLIRTIQDARKEAEYNVSDRIKLSITGDKIDQILNLFRDYIESETLSKITNLSDFDISKNLEIDEGKFELKLKK
ncbi:isoleucine--tRNA ligase [Candidatus Gracilibacteria bacterium]|nr:isoleucine--tRNA ligase [Candidatus Gracilibacteria bacterium]